MWLFLFVVTNNQAVITRFPGKLFLSVLLSFALYNTHAQFNYGIRAGGHVSVVRPGDRYLPAFSLHSGVFTSYRFSNRLSFIADALFVDKGFVLDTEDKIYDGSAVHFGYLDLPVILQYHISNRLAVFGGLQNSILLSARAEYNGQSENLYKYSRVYQTGFGAGFSIKISPRFTITARSFRDFGNVFKREYTQSDDEDSQNKFSNQTFQLSLAFSFRRDTVRLHLPLSEQKTKILVGFKQGMSINTLVVDNIEDNDVKIKDGFGYEAGFDLRFEAGKYFYLMPGIFYQQRGGQVTIGSEQYSPIKLNYLSFPLALGLSPIKTKPITLSGEFGFSLNYQFSAQNVFGEKANPGGHVSNNNIVTSKFFGLELATDRIRNLNVFLNYRKIEDIKDFTHRAYYSTPVPNDPIANLRLKNKSEIITLGLRWHLKRGIDRKHFLPRDSISKREYIKPFSIGLKGGLNLNNSNYTHTPDGYSDLSKALLDYHLGVYFQIRLFRNFSLQPELHYIRKGIRFDGPLGMETFRIPSVELPLMFSLAFQKKWLAEAGISGAVLLTGSKYNEYGNYSFSYGEYMEYGITGGVRYKLFPKLSIAARYYQGIESIGDHSLDYEVLGIKEFNNNIQLSAYWQLSKL